MELYIFRFFFYPNFKSRSKNNAESRLLILKKTIMLRNIYISILSNYLSHEILMFN